MIDEKKLALMLKIINEEWIPLTEAIIGKDNMVQKALHSVAKMMHSPEEYAVGEAVTNALSSTLETAMNDGEEQENRFNDDEWLKKNKIRPFNLKTGDLN